MTGDDSSLDFIAHYESKYYDPVKAHEYYLRTRELKGRTSTKGFTKNQKINFDYAKSKISEDKRQSKKELQESYKEELSKIREAAILKQQAARENILKLINSIVLENQRKLEKASKERDRITKQTLRRLEAIPEVPKNLSPATEKRFRARRQDEIAKIRGDAQRQTSELAKSLGTSGKNIAGLEENLKAKLKSDIENVRKELKSAIDSAKVNYKKLRDGLEAKYENEKQTAYDNIRLSR